MLFYLLALTLMLLYYLPQYFKIAFIQEPEQENEISKIIEEEKEKHYTPKELVNIAAEKLADIFVRTINKK